MRGRKLLIFTAILSSLLGAVVAYLVLTVPNDLKAGALLKDARRSIAAGHNDAARTSLTRIIQQYPRTDAAAAATVGLIELQNTERQVLQHQVEALSRAQSRQATSFGQLQQAVDAVKNAPPPPAPVVVTPPPAVKPAPTPPRKKVVHRKTSRHRR